MYALPCLACSLRRVPGVARKDLHLQHLHRVLSSQALFSCPLPAGGLSLSLPMDAAACSLMYQCLERPNPAELKPRRTAVRHSHARTCIVNKKTKRSLTSLEGNDWVGANTTAYQPVTGVADRRRTSSREETRGAFPALRQAMLEVIYVTRHGVSFSTHPRGSVAASCVVSGPGEATPGVGCSRDPHASVGSHHPAAEAIHMYLGMDGRQGRFRVLLLS